MCCHFTYSAKLSSVGQEEKRLPDISALLRMHYSFAFEHHWIYSSDFSTLSRSNRDFL
jgi:hypothetical protein